MLSQIFAGVLVLIAFSIIGFIFYLFFRSDERELENYFKHTVDELHNSGLLGIPKKHQQRSVIVETPHKFSRFRRDLSQFFQKLKGKEVDEVIYVFQADPVKQKVFLIKEATKNTFLLAELLDTKFVDTLVAYFAFKFASISHGIDPKVKMLLQKAYEESPQREIVVTLDDPEFNDKVVLNPAPEKKPILTELLIPMTLYKSEEVSIKRAEFSYREKYRTLFRRLIDKIYRGEIGVLYIGFFNLNHYIDLFDKAVFRFPKGFIIAARGSNIERLKYVWDKIDAQAESTWAVNFQATDIEGEWDFGKGFTKCHWKIVKVFPIEK